jgi:hypothetical protein
MATDRNVLLLCVLLLGTSGCVAPIGALYTQTTVPYKMPYETVGRVASKSCSVDITQLREPFSGLDISVIWTDRVVAEAMRNAGMTEFRYVDLQTVSILNGVYERRRLLFYGE